jgi:hypothetical protein
MILHIIVPLAISVIFFRQNWKASFVVMMLTMAVDIDHLLADPIYDPNRCSIGFHPLHKIIPIGIYAILSIFPKTRLVGIGLLIHMGLDGIDCKINTGEWLNQL